jgi:hypothetical protein
MMPVAPVDVEAPEPMPADLTASPSSTLDTEYYSSSTESPTLDDSGARDEAMRTIAALEQWLDAIHVARAHRSP